VRLKGKVAAVTGGTRGIGLGIARAVVNGRNPQRGQEAVDSLEAGDDAFFIAGDVLRQADVEAIVDGTVGRYGRIDILVNNAGGSKGFAPVVEMTNEAWQEAMDWNLNSTFWATRRALPYMIPQQWGRIINMSSVEGKHGKPAIAQYVTAKHAINGFTKSVAKEVGQLGITVNALCPGMVVTEWVQEQLEPAAAAMGITAEALIDTFVQESAIKRSITAEEVAAVAVLLASDAGSGITGALLSIDGGTAAY
jgi:NAD(P)-dependent dehydrogenase (short-subunit alcohol dehydrogenase family)